MKFGRLKNEKEKKKNNDKKTVSFQKLNYLSSGVEKSST